MNIESAFPSAYLKAADLDGQDLDVTISGLEIEPMGKGNQKEDKPVVYFEEIEKGLVLNKTNKNTIVNLAQTTETDDWIGTRITLYPTVVEMAGQSTEGIRIRPRIPKGRSQGRGAGTNTGGNKQAQTARRQQIEDDDEPVF